MSACSGGCAKTGGEKAGCASTAMDRRGLLRTAGGFAATLLAPGVTLYAFGARDAQARPAGEPASANVRWGMLIDLNKCKPGCNACVTACNEENGLKSSGRPEIDAAMDSQGHASRRLDRRRPGSARHVPALREAALRRRLPDRGLVQARRRHRAGRQAHLHRLPLLHDGLSVQGALLRA